jgi:ArsR family transcriptional regulator
MPSSGRKIFFYDLTKHSNIHILEYIGGDMVSLGQKAEVLKVIAHPVRIRILQELANGIKCVSDLEEFLELRQPNVSQHLTALRSRGLIDYYMDGRLRCYFLRDPMVPEILRVIGLDFEDALPGPECCPVTKRGKYPGSRRR